MTIRLLAQYQGNPPNTIVTLAGGVETALVAAGNATTDLSGGVPPVYVTPANSQIGDVLYGPDGVPLGVADRTGKLLMNFNGITVPGAPTGLTLTPIAGGVLAAFTPSATLGGTVGTGYEVTLSNGQVQRGAASPIVVNSPAGSVTATVKQINGAGLSAASAASASATVPAYIVPSPPAAPTIGTLVAGNGKVTVNWTAPAINGSALRGYLVTLSNGASAVAGPSATSIDITTPNDIAVTATVRASNGEGQGPTSAVSNSVTPAGASAARAFSVTESFAIGEQTIYAGGIYTFTANHAPGNWTGADATYNGQAGSRTLNTLGMSKPFGVVGTWTPGSPATTTVSTPASSRGLKQHMEAAFSRARVALFQREPTPLRGFAMSVASTEVEAVDTMSRAIDPIVGGVAYSVTRANSQYGLLRLTWNAALRSQVQPPASVISPGQNGLTGLSVVVSDWAACPSVPVPAGKRPLLVSRFSQTSAIGDSDANISVSAMTAEYNRFVANNPSARLYYCPSVGNGDHVADPTLSKAAGNVYNGAVSGAWKNIGIIVDHDTIPTRVFGGFGDSITEGYSWWQNAVWALSTVNAPCYVANFGCSTNRAAQYQALLNTMIRQDIPLTDIIMPTFSPNEVQAMTDALADGFIAGLVKVVALCEAFNRRLYLWTSYAAKTTRYSNSPTSVAAITKINDWARTEAAKPNAKFVLCEIEPGWNNATMNGDNTHPNGAGITYMQAQLLPVIQTGA